MAFHSETELNALRRLTNLAGGKLPPQEAVHKQTLKYIRADYDRNGRKMADADQKRIIDLLAAG